MALLYWWGSHLIEALTIIAGIGLGLSAYLFHEWAHLLAALRPKASVEFVNRWYAIFLLTMKIEEISKRAFLEVSFAGFLATLLNLILFSRSHPLMSNLLRFCLRNDYRPRARRRHTVL